MAGTPVPQVAGPAAIRIGDEGVALAALDLLGYTRNGAEMTSEGYFLNIPGDQNGGDDGPPIDVQYLGETARIRIELTKWDATIAAGIEARIQGGTGGTPGTPGSLMSANSHRLLIFTTAQARNFPRAFPRGAIELNKGTRFSILVFEFEAHEDASGVLWNTEIT